MSAVWWGCLPIGRSLAKEQVMVNFNEILNPDTWSQCADEAQWILFIFYGRRAEKPQREKLKGQRPINLSASSVSRPSLKTFYFLPSALLLLLSGEKCIKLCFTIEIEDGWDGKKVSDGDWIRLGSHYDKVMVWTVLIFTAFSVRSFAISVNTM